MLEQQYHGHAGMLIYAKPSQKTNELNAKLAERKAIRGKLGAEELNARDDLERGLVKQESRCVMSCFLVFRSPLIHTLTL